MLPLDDIEHEEYGAITSTPQMPAAQNTIFANLIRISSLMGAVMEANESVKVDSLKAEPLQQASDCRTGILLSRLQDSVR